ncbi:MAG: VWA domain-containing protein [Anaerolineae bacterium]|nr:VWA domain-containing protein [Anaerolineae bacterium]
MFKPRKENGGSLLLVALSLILLVGVLALAIDIGIAYAERRKVQNAVDAGSLAGATLLIDGATDAEILAIIDHYTVVENHVQAFEAHYIAVPNGPSIGEVGGGAVPNDATGIRVIAANESPTFFALMMGFDHVTVEAIGSGGFGTLDIVLVMDESGTMDDDSCSWKPYPPSGGNNCRSPLNPTNCQNCYVWSGGMRHYGVWSSPDQPMTDAKAAASAFVDMNNPQIAQLSLVSYEASVRLRQVLTENYPAVKTAIAALDADGCTNASGGIQKAIQELGSSRSRDDALHVIVFLTDGLPNYPQCSDCRDHCPAAKQAALNQAQIAANNGIIIFTISLGSKADQALMQQIADLTGGQHYYAPSSDDLLTIYGTIFEQIRLRLIE